MNIFGFLATIVICATVCAVTVWVCKHGIKITTQYEDKTVHAVDSPASNASVNDNEKLEEEINKTTVTKASMDAVIKSCNELMGIETEEVDDGQK